MRTGFLHVFSIDLMPIFDFDLGKWRSCTKSTKMHQSPQMRRLFTFVYARSFARFGDRPYLLQIPRYCLRDPTVLCGFSDV